MYTTKNKKLTIVGRCLTPVEWAAFIKFKDLGSIPPDRLVLHHTWSPTVAQWRGQHSVEAIAEYYAGKGWTAGPHIFAAPDGIWLFTDLYDVGIHAGIGNANAEFLRTWQIKDLKWYSVGLEMVGDYDKVPPAGAVWDNAKAVMGGLLRRFGKTPQQAISFHRDYTNLKSCPGWAVNKPWVYSEMTKWLTDHPR